MLRSDALTPRQLVAITALLNGSRQASAAKAHVSPRTLHRWLQMPAFRTELARQRSRVIVDGLTTIAAGVEEAGDTLRSIARNRRAPASARVAACKAILEFAAGYDERSSLLERLEAVERGLADASAPARGPFS